MQLQNLNPMDSKKNMNRKTAVSIIIILVLALFAGWLINSSKNQQAASVLSPSGDTSKTSETFSSVDLNKTPLTDTGTRSETESTDPNILVVTQDVNQILGGNLALQFTGTFSGNTNNYA